MHKRTILAIARKDALDILLNKTTLTVLLTPILLSVIFAVITALIGSKTTNILVYNPGRSGVVQVVSGAFADTSITQANSPEDVSNAFGADGTHKSSSYAMGLVVPANFDSSVRTGGHPQMNLYTNGDEVSIQQRQLLVAAITDYTRSLANPQPPASITTATINPPPPSNDALDLGKLYVMTAILTSFLVGTSLIPGLLIEEKEKKTLRMLMVSPASFSDVVVGKLLVGLAYQLLLSMVVLIIQHGFVGQIPILLLFTLLGSCFCLALGLLFGSIFQTGSSAGAVAGMVSFIYIIPAMAIILDKALPNNWILQITKVLPTYYIGDAVLNALQNKGTFGGTLFDMAIVLGSTVILLLIAVWTLRRQAAVASTI